MAPGLQDPDRDSKFPRFNVGENLRDSGSARLSALIAFAVDADGDFVGVLFFLADDEHGVDFGELRVADFAADLVATDVDFGADASAAKFVEDGLGVGVLRVADRQDADLLGRKPQWKISREMFNQNADKPLEAAERRAMNHHGPMAPVVRTNVFELEAIRQIII